MKYIFGIIAIVVLAGGLYLLKGPAALLPSTYTQKPLPTVSNLSYGDNVLKIGETGHFTDLTVEPLEVTEDSRCPESVQCIQAGTVRINLKVVSSMGTSTANLKLGDTFTTEAEQITFVSVEPKKFEGGQIQEGEYRFLLNISKKSIVLAPVVSTGCFIGGCSGEICSDQKGMMSNCIYKAEFACYKNAKCERQSTGQCGWTATPDLKLCIQNAE